VIGLLRDREMRIAVPLLFAFVSLASSFALE
jgi:hypothetical protein